MSEINNSNPGNINETPEALTGSQNVASYVEKNRRSRTAKITIYFSYLTIIGSFIAGWGAHQEEQSNEILAGVGQIIYLALAIVVNFVLLLVHIVDAKHKREAVSKLAVALLIAPIVIFIGFVNVANAISEFQDSRPPAPVEQKPLSKEEQEEIQAAAQKYRQKKIDTLQKYGFYYLTDDSSNIERLKLDYFLYTERDSTQKLVSLDTTFADKYMLKDASVGRITQIVAEKPNIANLQCYDAQSFFDTITSCASIAGSFAGHPIYKAVQEGSMRREGTYYYITDGKLLVEIESSSDEKVATIVGQLKPIDGQSARNLMQKLTAASSLVPNMTKYYK